MQEVGGIADVRPAVLRPVARSYDPTASIIVHTFTQDSNRWRRGFYRPSQQGLFVCHPCLKLGVKASSCQPASQSHKPHEIDKMSCPRIQSRSLSFRASNQELAARKRLMAMSHRMNPPSPAINFGNPSTTSLVSVTHKRDRVAAARVVGGLTLNARLKDRRSVMHVRATSAVQTLRPCPHSGVFLCQDMGLRAEPSRTSEGIFAVPCHQGPIPPQVNAISMVWLLTPNVPSSGRSMYTQSLHEDPRSNLTPMEHLDSDTSAALHAALSYAMRSTDGFQKALSNLPNPSSLVSYYRPGATGVEALEGRRRTRSELALFAALCTS